MSVYVHWNVFMGPGCQSKDSVFFKGNQGPKASKPDPIQWSSVCTTRTSQQSLSALHVSAGCKTVFHNHLIHITYRVLTFEHLPSLEFQCQIYFEHLDHMVKVCDEIISTQGPRITLYNQYWPILICDDHILVVLVLLLFFYINILT